MFIGFQGNATTLNITFKSVFCRILYFLYNISVILLVELVVSRQRLSRLRLATNHVALDVGLSVATETEPRFRLSRRPKQLEAATGFLIAQLPF